ncbi:ABC transporter substrate-binding protein [Tessaracoccus sp. ZS01]|uniref:ABC transporter substrate-binding protein n=1 Tax=Tessaracoccus sp. ZS01 TaxID=1906324 RepID=UPI00096BEFF9|nr:extracellular solute-binding protein [Tessaracoccus sp. ZS01]MCG6567442.1 sugar ABC transporter substrate-binding protein [Tessaracoccus sp. ZS01]OMG57009.1 sugar ABC transporter substrate-binding protein [Tessaracoccus sp. ZS01]
MNIRRVTAIAACATLALGLAACGGDSGTGTDGANGEADPRANQMYTWVSNESDREQWETFIAGVQEGGDSEFDITLDGPSFQEYWTLVKTRMAASDAPCIITTQAARAQELGSLLSPLDDLAKDAGLDLSQYNEAMMQGLTVDGTIRAIPYDAEPMLLFFNKEMFEAAGLELPGADYSREQFLSDAKALTKDDKYGFAVSADIGYPPLALSFANGVGPTKDGELNLTDPALIEDVQWTMDLVNKEQVAAAPNPGDTDEIGRQAFMAGNVGMFIDGPWFYSTYQEGSDFEVGIAAPPSDDGTPGGMIQGSGFGVADSCPDKAAAFENIVKMTTPDVVAYVGANRGTVPSIESAIDGWAEGKPEADVEVVKALLASGQPLVTTPTWNQVVTQFAQYSSDGYRGNKTAEDILTQIAQGVG